MERVAATSLLWALVIWGQQPIEFPHDKHVAKGLDCIDCHSRVDTRAAAGMPSVRKCMLCHRTIAADGPGVKQLPWEKPLETGRYLFLENCTVCHESGRHDSKKLGPSLFRLFQNKKLPFSGGEPTVEFVTAKIKNGSFLMPSFRAVLTDAQIDGIIEYIRSRH